MTDDGETGGSPPCLACEMDEAYAGFLPPGELAAEITWLLHLSERIPDPTRGRWRTVLEAALERLPSPAGSAIESQHASDLVGATRAFLPRIADDRLHAALKALVGP